MPGSMLSMVAPGLMPHAHAFPAPLQAHDVSGLALPPLERSALFFDVDGTLLDICPEPRDVVSDGDLRGLLDELLKHCHGALALVSGRALDDIDRIFSPLKFIAVGLHGAEIRDASGAERRADPRIMDHARKPVRDFVARLRDDHQMLTQGAGENVLRLLPPLIVNESDVAEAAQKIGDAFAALDAETAHEHVTA